MMTTVSIMQQHYLPWIGGSALVRLSDGSAQLDDLQIPKGRSLFLDYRWKASYKNFLVQLIFLIVIF